MLSSHRVPRPEEHFNEIIPRPIRHLAKSIGEGWASKEREGVDKFAPG